MSGILQPWVQELGLRHQGVLVSAVRGCDGVPKDDPSKRFVRCYRSMILVPHCGDPAKARSFIERVPDDELLSRFRAFRKSIDHYPCHYVLHLLHAIEVVGYKASSVMDRAIWSHFYGTLVGAMHLGVETEEQMDRRLDADEDTFAARDWCCDGAIAPADPASRYTRDYT